MNGILAEHFLDAAPIQLTPLVMTISQVNKGVVDSPMLSTGALLLFPQSTRLETKVILAIAEV